MNVLPDQTCFPFLVHHGQVTMKSSHRSQEKKLDAPGLPPLEHFRSLFGGQWAYISVQVVLYDLMCQASNVQRWVWCGWLYRTCASFQLIMCILSMACSATADWATFSDVNALLCSFICWSSVRLVCPMYALLHCTRDCLSVQWG